MFEKHYVQYNEIAVVNFKNTMPVVVPMSEVVVRNADQFYWEA